MIDVSDAVVFGSYKYTPLLKVSDPPLDMLTSMTISSGFTHIARDHCMANQQTIELHTGFTKPAR